MSNVTMRGIWEGFIDRLIIGSYMDYHEVVKKVFSHPDNFGELIGYRVTGVDDGYARTDLTIEEKHISPAGVAHGGVLSAFVDFSMGAALFQPVAKLKKRISTIEFKINYLSPVKLGETIHADARVKFLGSSHAVMECHVFRHEGKDIAVAMGTFNIY